MKLDWRDMPCLSGVLDVLSVSLWVSSGFSGSFISNMALGVLVMPKSPLVFIKCVNVCRWWTAVRFSVYSYFAHSRVEWKKWMNKWNCPGPYRNHRRNHLRFTFLHCNLSRTWKWPEKWFVQSCRQTAIFRFGCVSNWTVCICRVPGSQIKDMCQTYSKQEKNAAGKDWNGAVWTSARCVLVSWKVMLPLKPILNRVLTPITLREYRSE